MPIFKYNRKSYLKYYIHNNKLMYNYDFLLGKNAETSDAANSLFYQKIAGCNLYLMDEAAKTSFQSSLSSLSLTQAEKIFVFLALTGGAFREQMNYLGLFASAKSGEAVKQAIYKINQMYSVAGGCIGTYELELTDCSYGTHSTFYCLTDEGRAVADGILSKFGSISANSLKRSHPHNIEHASGVSDLLGYIMGNEYYPPTFELTTEEKFNAAQLSDRYVISDIELTTLKGRHYAAQDYVEIHTGSQHSQAIAEKLEAYSRQFANLSMEHDSYLNHNIMFLIHPAGSCAYMLQRRKTAAGRKKTFTHIGVLMSYLGTYTCSELITSLRKEQAADAFKSLSASLSFAGISPNDCSEILSLIKNEKDVGDYRGILRYLDNLKMNSPVERFEYYQNKYITIKRQILDSSLKNMSKKFPDSFKNLRAMFRQGLSLSTCFGSDMYKTSLFIHPFLTGAADACLSMLINSNIVNDSAALYDKNGFRGTIGACCQCDGLEFVFRNALPYMAEDGEISNICLEYVSGDYGAAVRISEAVKHPLLSAARIKLICLVDTPEDAYIFLVKHCYKALARSSSLCSYMSLNSLRGESAALSQQYDKTSRRLQMEVREKFRGPTLFLPLFITGQAVSNTLISEYKENAPGRPFVFSCLSIYEEILSGYGGKADAGFPAYFERELKNYSIEDDVIYI